MPTSLDMARASSVGSIGRIRQRAISVRLACAILKDESNSDWGLFGAHVDSYGRT